MKFFKGIVIFMSHIQTTLDPPQLAYKPNRSIEDTVSTTHSTLTKDIIVVPWRRKRRKQPSTLVTKRWTEWAPVFTSLRITQHIISGDELSTVYTDLEKAEEIQHAVSSGVQSWAPTPALSQTDLETAKHRSIQQVARASQTISATALPTVENLYQGHQ